MAIIDLTTYKALNNISTSDFDTQISTIIPMVEKTVNQYCNRIFGVQAEYTDPKRTGVVDHLGRYIFKMKEKPVSSVSSVSIRFFGVDTPLTVDVTKIDLFEESGIAYYAYGFNSSGVVIRPQYLEDFYYTVTYSGGESSVPSDVQLAASMIIHNTLEYINRTNSMVASGVAVTGELVGVKIGDYEEKYSNSQTSLFAKLLDKDGPVLTKTVVDLLAPYRVLGQST